MPKSHKLSAQNGKKYISQFGFTREADEKSIRPRRAVSLRARDQSH
jgi:hypothetical protein